jgi:hypothetical protein
VTAEGRTRLGAAGVLAAAFALVVVACGVPDDKGFQAVSSNDIPFGLDDSTTTTTTTTVATTVAPPTTLPPPSTTTTIPNEQVAVYYVLGRRLRPVLRSLPRGVTPAEALVELQRGPLEEDRPIGLRSSIVPEMLGQVTVSGGVATVDLSPSILGLSTTEQVLAFGQIVATLTARPGIGRVTFTIDGRPVNPPRADGSLAPDSVSCDDYVELIPPDAVVCPVSSTTVPTSTAPTTTAHT